MKRLAQMVHDLSPVCLTVCSSRASVIERLSHLGLLNSPLKKAHASAGDPISCYGRSGLRISAPENVVGCTCRRKAYQDSHVSGTA